MNQAGKTGDVVDDSEMRAIEPGRVPRDVLDNNHLCLIFAAALAPDSNYVDIGCLRGALLRKAIKLAPRGHHVAFEPLPEFHARLVAEFPAVDIRRVALSNHAGRASFTHVTRHPGYSGFRERAYPTQDEEITLIEVEVTTLDAALAPDYVPTLIKIDVEGAEREVLEGAIGTITKHRPIVIFEHGRGGADRYGTEPRHLYELLCVQAGLRLFDIEANGPLSLSEMEDIYARGTLWNFFARP